MKTMLMIQMPANTNILPSNPSASTTYGRNFVVANASSHMSAIQNVIPNSFNFSGIISEMTTNGSGKMAHEAINITNEKLANAIQLNDSTE